MCWTYKKKLNVECENYVKLRNLVDGTMMTMKMMSLLLVNLYLSLFHDLIILMYHNIKKQH